MTGICTAGCFLRRVSLSVTARLLLAAAHSCPLDAPTQTREYLDLLKVSVSLACPSVLPHMDMVSELAPRSGLSTTFCYRVNQRTQFQGRG